MGVVGDAKYDNPRESTPNTIYLTAFQEGRAFAHNVILRSSQAPEAVTGEALRAVSEILKGVRVERVTTMAEQVDATIVPERLVAMLSAAFGALGSMLAAIGLYGLLAYTVARRVSEIGIRMALGATPADATRMVLRDALKMVAAGLAIGIPVAFGSMRFAATVLAGLPLENPVPIAVGAVAMIAVAHAGGLCAGTASGSRGSDGSFAARLARCRPPNQLAAHGIGRRSPVTIAASARPIPKPRNRELRRQSS